MDANEDGPYRVEMQDGVCRVEDGAGNAILEARDKATVAHYADLLNKAYHAGYKAGYRDGKGLAGGD